MKILSIETSCDETSAAVVEKTDVVGVVKVLSNVTATSLAIHAQTGGIIPENAAREQVKYIIPVIVEALLISDGIKPSTSEKDFLIANKILKEKIDSIAVTFGPGLIGSLLIGVETAKALSFSFNKPIVPVNHLIAHLYANFINNQQSIRDNHSIFPFIGLIVSGAHTDLLFFESYTKFKWLGGTRDDAAGEAFDKIGRLLNFPYPAGPEIERRASKITETNIKFVSPMINSKDFDFSFSGLKAEVSRYVAATKIKNDKQKNEICYAVQKAIFDVLIKKTLKAAKKYNVDNILIGGGVSASNTLKKEFEQRAKSQLPSAKIFTPEKIYATDNAAMIGVYASLNYKPKTYEKITADPELYFS